MDELLKKLSRVDYNIYEDSPEYPEHNNIRKLVEKAAYTTTNDVPLMLARDALINIASPGCFVLKDIPKLLFLLSTFEVRRNHNVELIRHNFPHLLVHKTKVKLSGRIDRELEEELAHTTQEAHGLHDLFWSIVVQCVQIRLKHRALTTSFSKFWRTFHELLPFLSHTEDETPATSFRHGMNAREKEALKDGVADCLSELAKANFDPKNFNFSKEKLEEDGREVALLIVHYVKSVCAHEQALDDVCEVVDVTR